MIYEIAGIKADFRTDSEQLLCGFRPYISCGEGVPYSLVEVNGCDFIAPPQGRLILSDVFKWYEVEEGDAAEGLAVCLPNANNGSEFVCRVDVLDGWKKVSILYLINKQGMGNAITNIIGNLLFRNMILYDDGILMHASAINWKGTGIIFTAPSRTGKSTHAALWGKYKGAVVINDDTTAIKIEDNELYIYATPWNEPSSNSSINSPSNSSNNSSIKSYCPCNDSNHSVPLKMIVILQQSNENAIRRITGPELLPGILPRFMLPYHDSKLMSKAMDIVGKIASAVPVYILKCRPDMEAVETVLECIT